MKHLFDRLLCFLFFHQWDNSALVDGIGEVHCIRCHKAWYVDSAVRRMTSIKKGANG